jgi:MoxR-like ATPase
MDLKKQAEQGVDLTKRFEGRNDVKVKSVLENKHDFLIMQELAKTIAIENEFAQAVINIVRAARPGDETAPQYVKDAVAVGPGPRAHQTFAQVAKGRALLEGRYCTSIKDVRPLAKGILEHRMKMKSPRDDAGEIIDQLLDDHLGVSPN